MSEAEGVYEGSSIGLWDWMGEETELLLAAD